MRAADNTIYFILVRCRCRFIFAKMMQMLFKFLSIGNDQMHIISQISHGDIDVVPLYFAWCFGYGYSENIFFLNRNSTGKSVHYLCPAFEFIISVQSIDLNVKKKRQRKNGVPQVIKKYDKCCYCWKLKMRKINWKNKNKWRMIRAMRNASFDWRLFILSCAVQCARAHGSFNLFLHFRLKHWTECPEIRTLSLSDHWILWIITAITLIEYFCCFLCWFFFSFWRWFLFHNWFFQWPN